MMGRGRCLAIGASLVSSALSLLCWSEPARAQSSAAYVSPSSNDDAARQQDEASSTPKHRPLRMGVLGGVGFPHPFAVEGLAKIDDTVAVGVEYATMPKLTISDIDTRLWSVAGDLRVFPLRGVLFLGMRAGRQHIGADTTVISEERGLVPAGIRVDSWYLNPRVGLLWTSSFGLAVGADFGLQVPVASDVSSSFPAGPANDTAVRIANSLGKTVVPTVDVLRLGLVL